MNPDGTTTLNDFANVWLEADASVRRLIANSDMKIRESQIKRDETGVQLRAVKEHENYNPNMLIGESKLTIEIIDGRGFVNERNQQFNPCIFVFCENQRYEVRNPDMDQQGRFVWNERVTIPIKYAKSDFLIQVSSYSNPLLPIMEISYPLERLSDQIAHSETLTLQFMDGTASNATVNCNMQWLYSRSKFYTNIIDLLDKEIQRDTQDKKAAEEGLRGLYMLFPTFNAVLPRNVNYATMGRFNDLQPKVASNEPTLGRAAKGTSTYARPIMYLSFAIFILAMLCCFIKAQFLDVVDCLTSALHCPDMDYLYNHWCTQNDLQTRPRLHRNDSCQPDPRLRLVLVLQKSMVE
jgi:hypothetical protein